jgi:wyosine [tRNA(Phe)-imidazoG37] synthetase (radical SAM superfamily)
MSVTESVEKNNIIFGPVHSRRFGVSLGVDLSPSHKQCNFDCLYCELSPAATLTQQESVVPVANIMKELKEHLNNNIDVITLTANGEPTLYPYLDELIKELNAIKENAQTLILTNSAALTDEKIFHSLLELDQVKLSLDAVTPEVFKKIDRPHPTICVKDIITKVKAFSKQYKGKLFIEILFVHGLNDTKEELQKLNETLLKIDATRIDLSTIDRPPAYPVTGLSYKELHTLAQSFDASLPIHIASRQHAEANQQSYTKEEILNTLDKRPLTQEDIEILFDEKSKNLLQELLENGAVSKVKYDRVTFYMPTNNIKRKRTKK